MEQVRVFFPARRISCTRKVDESWLIISSERNERLEKKSKSTEIL